MTESAVHLACPRCGEPDPVPIVYGLPLRETFEAAGRGEFALGGCVIEPMSPDWRCRRCAHAWRDDSGHRLEGIAGVWIDD